MNSKIAISEYSTSLLLGYGLAGLALALIFLLGIASSSQAGQYYKCVGPEGKIVLSNMMCPKELKKEKSYSLEEVPDRDARKKNESHAKEKTSEGVGTSAVREEK